MRRPTPEAPQVQPKHQHFASMGEEMRRYWSKMLYQGRRKVQSTLGSIHTLIDHREAHGPGTHRRRDSPGISGGEHRHSRTGAQDRSNISDTTTATAGQGRGSTPRDEVDRADTIHHVGRKQTGKHETKELMGGGAEANRSNDGTQHRHHQAAPEVTRGTAGVPPAE